MTTHNPRIIVFDIETANQFSDVGSHDPAALTLSLLGMYDSHTDSYDSFLEPELPRLWKILEQADILVGYNSDHFDIPLLNKYYPGDLTKMKSLDLLKEIYDVLGRRIKLDDIAAGTLGEGKSSHGLQAVKWWREGKVEEVRKYCLKDVEITKRVFDYAMKNKSLKYKELGKIKELKINTDHWLTTEGSSALTHTLGF